MATKRAAMKEVISKEFGTRDLPLKGVYDSHDEPVTDPMEVFSIRLPQSQKNALQRYFKQEMGLDMSSGVRMILTGYMREKSIR